uniref:Uncharacterized protein n=1 Tax=Rangifer tarandus platyrhynchus TaxID=3082113 RepID=A0ACB0EXA9_RANTA|nr:unnamed protein product [Rangifer tarandus platyrhynchus]
MQRQASAFGESPPRPVQAALLLSGTWAAPSAAAPHSHPAQPGAHPGPQAGPSQPSDKCQLCALTASGQDRLRLSRHGPASSTCGG